MDLKDIKLKELVHSCELDYLEQIANIKGIDVKHYIEELIISGLLKDMDSLGIKVPRI